jgi:hypothetical protein
MVQGRRRGLGVAVIVMMQQLRPPNDAVSSIRESRAARGAGT